MDKIGGLLEIVRLFPLSRIAFWGWHCSIAHEAATCDASSPDEHWFESWLLCLRVSLGKQRKIAQRGLLPALWETRMEFYSSALAWASPGCCGHCRSESAYVLLSLSLPMYLSPFYPACQINPLRPILPFALHARIALFFSLLRISKNPLLT